MAAKNTQQEVAQEQQVRLTLRTSAGFEYHLVKPASVVRDIIDPAVSDRFIEVPVPDAVKGSVKKKYIHTSVIKELDVHDDL